MTQTEIAEVVGVSRTTVAAWEGNVQEPTGQNLLNLARRLGTSPAEILYGVHQQSLVRDAQVQVDTWRAAARYLRSSDRPGVVEEADVLERCADQMEEVIRRFVEEDQPEEGEAAVDPGEHGRRMGATARESRGRSSGSEKRGSGKR